MSGAAAAKQIKKKRKKGHHSPKKKGFSFIKSRTQELQDIRNASQQRALEKLQQTFKHFSIDEDEATYDITASSKTQIELNDAITAPPSQTEDSKEDITPKDNDNDATTTENGTNETKDEGTEEEKQEKGDTPEEDDVAIKNKDNDETKVETEQQESKEGETETDPATTPPTDAPTDPTDPTATTEETKTTEGETTEGTETDVNETKEEGDDSIPTTEGNVSIIEEDNGSKTKDVPDVQETSTDKKPKKGFMNRLGSMFTKKKKKEKKIWKAVPGAFASGQKDVENWNQMVAHYQTIIQDKTDHQQDNQTDSKEENEQKNEQKNENGSAAIGDELFWANFNMAMCLDCRGQHNEAIDYYSSASQMRPDNVGLRYRLGVLLATVREDDNDVMIEKRKENHQQDDNRDVLNPEDEDDYDDEEDEEEEEEIKPESYNHFVKVLQEDPTHSGALFELGSYEHTHGNYHSAISLLKKAIDGNQETVNEKTRDEYLGAPSIADAKSALATVMSLESYCPDHMFDTYRMEEGTGVYDTDVPIEIDSDVWNRAKMLFEELKDVRDSKEYLPPIVQHVLGKPPSDSKN